VSGGSPAHGGAIHSSAVVQGAGATLENSTVSDNTAVSPGGNSLGGGIYVTDSTRLTHMTISENSSSDGVGGFYDANGLSQVFSTLLARNGGAECGGNMAALGAGTESHNLADDASCALDQPGDRVVADARLASLANNGGGTQTHALLAGSPAINGAGTAACPDNDQRGLARPQGAACDIGAFEAPPPVQQQPPQGGGNTQPPPVGTGQELPPPTAGEEVNAEVARGTVRVKLPGSNRFVELTEPQQLPVGTVVNTLRGRITLIAAGGQTATFYDGIFRIGQGKGARPLTTLTLVEALSCPRAGGAVAAAKKKKRRLWGNGRGRFRTKGKHSAATVVGTTWLVEDRCTSTLTRVTQGRVRVRDFVKKKTVTVRAGKKYVARARGR
jgi:hypothetical protein